MSIDYKQFRADILSRTNIAAEAESRGVRFAGEAGEDGWRPCHAIGREDGNPSAALNVRTGVYTDSGASGSGKPIGFFELMSRLGFSDWKAAQDHFADKAGIASPASKGGAPFKKDPKFDGEVWPNETDPKLLIDSFPWPMALVDWAKSKPGIEVAAIRDGRLITGYWPARAQKSKRQRVVGIPFYSATDLNTPTGFQLFRADGEYFPAFQKLAARKCHNAGGKNGIAYVGTAEAFQAATDCILLEGPSDMLAVASRLPAGFIAATLKCGAKSIPKELASIFTGKRVWVCRDRDEAGEEGEAIVIETLLPIATELRLIRLPYPCEKKKGKDARDFFNEGGTWESFSALAEIIDPTKWEKPVGVLKIEVTFDRERVVNDAIFALNVADRIRQRGGQLVHVVRDAKAPQCISRELGLPRIVPLPLPTLAEHLTSAADFVTISEKNGEEITTRIDPPDWLIKSVDARGEWRIKPLIGIAETPIIRPDGTILASPGYDNATGFLYSPQIEFPPVPSNPSLDDAKAAADELLAVVCDFPFQTPAHKAAWLAAALTPPARASIDGPVPLVTIDANSPGSGKTLLADTIGLIFTGAKLPRTSAPPTDVEMQKTLLAIAIAGDPLILFDNQSGAFGCAALDAALTGASVAGRILGASKMSGSVPFITQLFVTGNNLVLAGDTARRALPIRIETKEENPEERQGFTHPNLLEWVAKERGRLAVAAVTVLRAYHLAECPKIANGKPWGSYEAWSDLIRNAVVWLGYDDPADLREGLRQSSDRTGNTLRLLIAGWEQADPTRAGITVSAMLRKLDSTKDAAIDPYPALREAVASLTKPGAEPNAQSIGQKIRHLQKRICGGKWFDKQEVNGVQVWSVGVNTQDTQSNSSGSTSNNGSKIHTPMETKKTHLSESENNNAHRRDDTTPVYPATPRPACNHLDSSTWVRKGNDLFCPGCGKWKSKADQRVIAN